MIAPPDRLLLARVLIDGPAELVFDYSYPVAWDVQVGCRVEVPLRQRLAHGTVLGLHDEDHNAGNWRSIHALIDPEPLIRKPMIDLARWISDYYGAPLETVIRSLLPESVRGEKHHAKTQIGLRLLRSPTPEEQAQLQKRAPKQWQIIEQLNIHAQQAMLLTELGSPAAATVRALEEKSWVERCEIAMERLPDADLDEQIVPSAPLALNDEQRRALESIASAISLPRLPQLILGVTGSGKTEVYLQAAHAALALGKTVLVLVPEISLTPQTVRRFKARFAQSEFRIAVLHSHLSQGERFDEWHRIRRGEASIVIGARSAVFAPLPRLGLIIVDEEHEASYKQETVPRYHGRDVAVLRANIEQCAIVLGSATPSLESFQNSLDGKYELLRLTQRVDSQSMPLVRVLDMRIEQQKQKRNTVIISDRLRFALEQRLERGEQSMLFLNRRGFSRSLLCPTCGHVCKCPHCSVSLTYHRSDERLICHVCGHQAIVPKRCPACNDMSILFQGYGTQKVEDIVANLLPQAKVARLDADAMRQKNTMRDLLRAFSAKKIQILIGTQMIAKGLHFPNVTLVGILNADLGLHVPDFRAAERTFQLITQVAGRAGRGNLLGEVIVQTATPHAPAIQFARRHDFDGFAEQELEFRQAFGFPPFGRCATLTVRSTHEQRAEFCLASLHRRLLEHLPAGIDVSEPLPSPLVKSHGQFRFQVTLRGRHARPLTRHVQSVLQKNPLPDDVIATYDMDAQQFT